MKKLLLIVPLVAMFALFNSCTKDDMNDGSAVSDKTETPYVYDFEEGYFKTMLQNAPVSPSALKSSSSVSPIIASVAPPQPIVNPTGSKLLRATSSIAVNWKADSSPNLDVSGHADTLWALVWANVDSAFGGGHPYAMYRVAGKAIGNNGKVNISGTLHEGQTADYYPTVPGATMPLVDAENNFFLFITKSHGPMNPAMMPAQIHTFNGGCDGDPDSGGPLAPCYEWLYSFHI